MAAPKVALWEFTAVMAESNCVKRRMPCVSAAAVGPLRYEISRTHVRLTQSEQACRHDCEISPKST